MSNECSLLTLHMTDRQAILSLSAPALQDPLRRCHRPRHSPPAARKLHPTFKLGPSAVATAAAAARDGRTARRVGVEAHPPFPVLPYPSDRRTDADRAPLDTDIYVRSCSIPSAPFQWRHGTSGWEMRVVERDREKASLR